jgi:hypothetical protein
LAGGTSGEERHQPVELVVAVVEGVVLPREALRLGAQPVGLGPVLVDRLPQPRPLASTWPASRPVSIASAFAACITWATLSSLILQNATSTRD